MREHLSDFPKGTSTTLVGKVEEIVQASNVPFEQRRSVLK